jgi:hypothetical protein
MADSPLERLAGAWEFEPFVEGRSMGRGRATFEWIEDGAFLLERSHADWTDPGWVENAPVSTQSVVGFDDTTFEVTQLYADDRGVFRIYRGKVTTSGGSGGLPPTSTNALWARSATTAGRSRAGGSPHPTAQPGSSTSLSPTARPADHYHPDRARDPDRTLLGRLPWS